ncbi:MAG: MerR family transcriptional regulator [Oscillospiraceae bacterium]|jgi:DNA-binding transcriptional MerR regulator|nr:MerR family transcriptional regulator [Oscillospiraceae bacterium]
MTITEASEKFGIAPEKLHDYEVQGFFDCRKKPDGTIDYCKELLDYVGIINLLLEAGASADTLRSFLLRLMQNGISTEEKLKFLRCQRLRLLDTIHAKQELLDQLDFIIFKETKESD